MKKIPQRKEEMKKAKEMRDKCKDKERKEDRNRRNIYGRLF